MKTLAVMSMAFLPATFLAAVFAMPSLTGDRTSGPGFKVYLALSIPTTVAILLGWAAITQRQAIRVLLPSLRIRLESTHLQDLFSWDTITQYHRQLVQRVRQGIERQSKSSSPEQDVDMASVESQRRKHSAENDQLPQRDVAGSSQQPQSSPPGA